MSENLEAYKKYKKYKLKYKLKSKEYKLKSKDSKLYQSMVMKGGATTSEKPIEPCTKKGTVCYRKINNGVVEKYSGWDTKRVLGFESGRRLSCLPDITFLKVLNFSLEWETFKSKSFRVLHKMDAELNKIEKDASESVEKNVQTLTITSLLSDVGEITGQAPTIISLLSEIVDSKQAPTISKLLYEISVSTQEPSISSLLNDIDNANKETDLKETKIISFLSKIAKIAEITELPGKIEGKCTSADQRRAVIWNVFLETLRLIRAEFYEYFQDKIKIRIFIPILISKYLQPVATTFIKEQKTLFQPGNTVNETNFFIQKLQLPSDSKIAVVGDLHGGFQDLMVFIKSIRKLGFFKNNYKLADNHYIFSLGDMVDRGPSSLEVVFFLLLLKNENPEHVFIVNGNHEGSMTYQVNGHDWLYRVNNLHQSGKIDDAVYESDNETFTPFWYLPRAIFVQFKGMEKWIQFCHGGLDGYTGYDDTNRKGLHNNLEIQQFLESSDVIKTFDQDTYQKDGLRWSDFGIDPSGNSDDVRPSTRERPPRPKDAPDVGNLYGISSTDDLLQKNNLECIIRGHQDMVTGFALLPSNPTDQDTPTDCESTPFTVGSLNTNTIQTDIYMNIKHGNIDSLPGLTPTPFSNLAADNTYDGERAPLLCSIDGKKKFKKKETPAQKVNLNSTNFNVLTTSNCKQAKGSVKLDNSFVIVTKLNRSS